MNLCSACGEDFSGVSDFDSHRVGKFPQTGPADYLDRVRAGLVDEDWKPSFGRRCLDGDEMTAKGWELDGRGRWASPHSLRGRIRAQTAREAING